MVTVHRWETSCGRASKFVKEIQIPNKDIKIKKRRIQKQGQFEVQGVSVLLQHFFLIIFYYFYFCTCNVLSNWACHWWKGIFFNGGSVKKIVINKFTPTSAQTNSKMEEVISRQAQKKMSLMLRQMKIHCQMVLMTLCSLGFLN